jgi:hypothetical protein
MRDERHDIISHDMTSYHMTCLDIHNPIPVYPVLSSQPGIYNCHTVAHLMDGAGLRAHSRLRHHVSPEVLVAEEGANHGGLACAQAGRGGACVAIIRSREYASISFLRDYEKTKLTEEDKTATRNMINRFATHKPTDMQTDNIEDRGGDSERYRRPQAAKVKLPAPP